MTPEGRSRIFKADRHRRYIQQANTLTNTETSRVGQVACISGWISVYCYGSPYVEVATPIFMCRILKAKVPKVRLPSPGS